MCDGSGGGRCNVDEVIPAWTETSERYTMAIHTLHREFIAFKTRKSRKCKELEGQAVLVG